MCFARLGLDSGQAILKVSLRLYSLLNGILFTAITIPSSLNEYQTFIKSLKTLGLKVLKIEAVCSVGVFAANADCQTGNELKN